MERTLVLAKPDALQRGLVGEIISRLERKGLKLVGLKMMTLTDKKWTEHYGHLASKPFFPGLLKFISSTPVVAMCWEGIDAVNVLRLMCGATNSRQASPGTIRGDLSDSTSCNLIHASDSLDTAGKEIPRFFTDDDLHAYERAGKEYFFAPDEI